MGEITYINGKEELLKEVKPLWEKLNEHHKSKTIDFYNKFSSFTFEERMKGLLKENIIINIDLAKAEGSGENVGYCISTINNEGLGEIQSIFVCKEYRKYLIGQALMDRAMEFLEAKNINKIIIGVAAGNEEAIGFYERFGFRKRTTILEKD